MSTVERNLLDREVPAHRHRNCDHHQRSRRGHLPKSSALSQWSGTDEEVSMYISALSSTGQTLYFRKVSYWQTAFMQPTIQTKPRCIQRPLVYILCHRTATVESVLRWVHRPVTLTTFWLRLVPLKMLFNIVRWCGKLFAYLPTSGASSSSFRRLHSSGLMPSARSETSLPW